MSSKNKYSILKVTFIFVLIMLSVGLVSAKLFYEKQVEFYNKMIFPSLENGSISIFNAYDSTVEGNADDKIHLLPGDSYKGLMGIKNHQTKEVNVELDYLPFELYQEEDNEQKIINKHELIQISKRYLNIAPNGVEFVNYSIDVPENFEEGLYVASLRAKLQGADNKKISDRGIVLDTAMGVKVKMVIGDKMTSDQFVDLSQQAKEKALNNLYFYSRYFVAILFGGISILMLFFAYKKND